MVRIGYGQQNLCVPQGQLVEGKTGGKIVVEYYSPADLERVIDLIMG